MKIQFICTWGIRCGIAVYQLYLARSLKRLGHDVSVLDIRKTPAELEAAIKSFKPDVLHLQYEPAFGLIDTFLPLGRLVPTSVVTCHRPTMEHLPLFRRYYKGIVVHRNVPAEFCDARLWKAPMAAPVTEKMDQIEARKSLSIPPDARVIATFGFLSGYKGFDQVLACMIPHLKEYKDVWSIWLTSEHFMAPTSGESAQRRMAKIAQDAGVADRFVHHTEFLTDEQINRHLQAADLGFIWCGQHTGGNSAAGLQFISARIPCVVTESDHFHTIPGGVVRSPFDIGEFCKTVFHTLNNPEMLRSLKQEAIAAYEQINYHEVANEYAKYYERLSHEAV